MAIGARALPNTSGKPRRRLVEQDTRCLKLMLWCATLGATGSCTRVFVEYN